MYWHTSDQEVGMHRYGVLGMLAVYTLEQLCYSNQVCLYGLFFVILCGF